MNVSFTVDWIAATFEDYGGFKFAKKLGYLGWATDVPSVPARGYNRCREMDTGVRISTHTERREMGVHVQLSGAALRWYQEKSLSWKTILEWVKACGGRVSRIDLAIDIVDSGLKMSEFTEGKLLPYKGKGRTPSYVPMGTESRGMSVYIGSRSSEKFLRIYDKAKELGDYVGDYKRVELECKGTVAHACGFQFAEIPESECVEMARTLIRGTADFSLPQWQAALYGRDVYLSQPQGKARDTMGWLLKSAAPALAKEILKRPKHAILEEFLSVVERHIKRMSEVPRIDD